MINPSASGWIDKFFSAKAYMPAAAVLTPDDFYGTVRGMGFIYGYVPSFGSNGTSKGWTSEETSKVAMLDALYGIFRLTTGQESPKEFVLKAIRFYKEMSPKGFDLLKKVLPSPTPSHELESTIDERVQTNENIISKNFSHILTNALLFMDVLAFRQYLLNGDIPGNYLKKLEETVVSIISLALKEKSSKSEYDELLTKLFEASVRFTRFSEIGAEHLEKLELGYFKSELEKYYLLDMAGMALWSDAATEKELDFLMRLSGYLKISREKAEESIALFDNFIKTNRQEISYFKYSNPVKHLYDHASRGVIVLIKRNKNRLIKELSHNAELMLLLTHSTHRSLDEKEKKKVKKQLLEICKAIPSLTIFLLPGGSLLLPILVKFIPQLLPSVFNENLDNE